MLAWQTLPRAVYSILNSSDISHDRLNSLSGSGVMDSIAFLMPGMKNKTCIGSRVSMYTNVGISEETVMCREGEGLKMLDWKMHNKECTWPAFVLIFIVLPDRPETCLACVSDAVCMLLQ